MDSKGYVLSYLAMAGSLFYLVSSLAWALLMIFYIKLSLIVYLLAIAGCALSIYECFVNDKESYTWEEAKKGIFMALIAIGLMTFSISQFLTLYTLDDLLR